MKDKIYKILQTGTGREFFISAKKLPKLINFINFIKRNFNNTEEEILNDIKNNEILIYEVKINKF